MAGILDGILNLGLMGTFVKKLLSPRYCDSCNSYLFHVLRLTESKFFLGIRRRPTRPYIKK